MRPSNAIVALAIGVSFQMSSFVVAAAESATAVQPAPKAATAELKATPGNGVSGTMTLKAEGDGVRLTGSVTGLEPNSTHGFHVHEKGDCSAPDASSAGGHYNPTSQPHGDPKGSQHHLGDMTNIVADAKGTAKLDLKLDHVTLRSGGANDLVGKAIIVHGGPDDYKSQPSGNSGPRIACAIIK
jgi:Cu-Zn family superoxide dismutase